MNDETHLRAALILDDLVDYLPCNIMCDVRDDIIEYVFYVYYLNKNENEINSAIFVYEIEEDFVNNNDSSKLIEDVIKFFNKRLLKLKVNNDFLILVNHNFLDTKSMNKLEEKLQKIYIELNNLLNYDIVIEQHEEIFVNDVKTINFVRFIVYIDNNNLRRQHFFEYQLTKKYVEINEINEIVNKVVEKYLAVLEHLRNQYGIKFLIKTEN